jgi:hypothetical protein
MDYVYVLSKMAVVRATGTLAYSSSFLKGTEVEN